MAEKILLQPPENGASGVVRSKIVLEVARHDCGDFRPDSLAARFSGVFATNFFDHTLLQSVEEEAARSTALNYLQIRGRSRWLVRNPG